jgi:hypothetical protein
MIIEYGYRESKLKTESFRLPETDRACGARLANEHSKQKDSPRLTLTQGNHRRRIARDS